MMRLGRGIVAVIAAGWGFIKIGWVTAMPSRFSAFMVAAGAVLILFTDQGRDIIVGFSDSDHGQRLTIFLFCVAWLAFQSWYWARVALELNQGTDRERWNVFTEWLPRLYGAICYALAVYAFWRVDEGYQAIIVALSGVVFVAFVVHRYHLARLLMPRLKKRAVTRGVTEALTTRQDTGKQGFRQAVDFAPIRKIALLGSIAFSIVTLGLIVWNPVGVGQWFGPAAIAFLAFGHIVPVGSTAVILATEARIPIISLVFAVAFVLSGFFNNHVVPVIPGTGPSVAERETVPDAASDWLKTAKPESDPNRPIPIVFVSTAGGGLRAAYWTSTVLGSLWDACDAFVPHLFSISGVSGGSVGTAFFVASTKSGMTAPSSAACSPDVPKPDNRTNTAKRLMLTAESADFLGPTVAALLYPDFVYRLAPLPFLKDRGQALADAWSDSWRSLCTAGDCAEKHDGDFFDKAFLVSSAESSAAWSPMLFFNGTHQETGKRIIASNVQVTDSVFSDALDLQGLIRGDVTLKTAVLNSARFTYVSPAGELVRDHNGAKIDEGHVLDGGYFENYGAVTSKQAAEAALRRLDNEGVEVMPIFIQISSDPDLSNDDDPSVKTCTGSPAMADVAQETKDQTKPSGQGRLWANELLAPIRGLMNTREARGILAMKSLACLATAIHEGRGSYEHVPDAVFVHFRMCNEPGKEPPPLGWLMSQQARNEIEDLLAHGCNGRNAKAFASVMAALKR